MDCVVGSMRQLEEARISKKRPRSVTYERGEVRDAVLPVGTRGLDGVIVDCDRVGNRNERFVAFKGGHACSSGAASEEVRFEMPLPFSPLAPSLLQARHGE